MREKQVEVARVIVMKKMLYAEEVEGGSRVRDSERIPENSRSLPEQRDRPMSDICFNEVGLAFIAIVICSTAEMTHKS